MNDTDIKNIRVWLGGSFDPLHLGHLAIVTHIATVLTNYIRTAQLKKLAITICLLPTAHNPLKPNPTDTLHRLAMLSLGLDYLRQHSCHEAINFQIDTTEIYQTAQVFTFNTFSHFRNKYPNDSLIFVLGIDSILMFDKWYRGLDLPSLCHLWVMPRQQANLGANPQILPKAFQSFLSHEVADLINTPYGRIYLDEHHVISVSSSQIRTELSIFNQSAKVLLNQWLLPSVLSYIVENNLYHVPKNPAQRATHP